MKIFDLCNYCFLHFKIDSISKNSMNDTTILLQLLLLLNIEVVKTNFKISFTFFVILPNHSFFFFNLHRYNDVIMLIIIIYTYYLYILIKYIMNLLISIPYRLSNNLYDIVISIHHDKHIHQQIYIHCHTL